MDMKKALPHTCIIFTAIILFIIGSTTGAFAIGEFSIGINGGVTYDPNHLGPYIDHQNREWKAAGGDVSQMDTPYAAVAGFSMRYQFNYFLFRIGFHYATPMQDIKGEGGGVKYTIDTYQASLPATIGLILPLRKRTYFFLGGGLTYHYAYLNIKTDPGGETRFADAIAGYHFMVGAEVPVTDDITISSEWIHQEGRSIPIEDDKGSGEKYTINVKGDILLFGINYYISM